MALVKIDQSAFEKVLPQSKDFFLLCFQTAATSDADILKTIEEMSTDFSEKIQTFVVDEDDLNYFQNTFNFWGTPIYILLYEGVEKDRLLGKVSKETLRQFISRNISDKEPAR